MLPPRCVPLSASQPCQFRSLFLPVFSFYAPQHAPNRYILCIVVCPEDDFERPFSELDLSAFGRF